MSTRSRAACLAAAVCLAVVPMALGIVPAEAESVPAIVLTGDRSGVR